jgi:hypothetical protein
MGYDYTCDAQIADRCVGDGDVPGLAGQFREQSWLTGEFGGRMQDRGYELHDTITICPHCTFELLTTATTR